MSESSIRVHRSFTYSVEHKILVWFTKRLPSFIHPDHLTVIGILGAVFSSVAYILTNFDDCFLWISSLGFVINWFGDSLDGSLARVRNIERPIYGFYLDHNVDAITTLIIGLGAGLSPYLHFYSPLIFVISYFLLSIHAYINKSLINVFKISYGKFGPTEVRIIIIIFNTILYFIKSTHQFEIFNIPINIFDFLLLVLSIIIFILYIISFFKNLKKMAEIDPAKHK